MSAPQPTAPDTVVCEVSSSDSIVAFVHRLGGPVIVTAYDSEGDPVGYEGAVEIDENEVEVLVVPGTVDRLVAELRPADDDLPGDVLIDPDPRARQVPGIGRVVEPPITGP